MVLLSVAEAAEHTGVSGAWLRRLLKDHEILGTKIGNYWAVDEESLRRYLAQPQTRGRPRRNAPTDRSTAKRRQAPRNTGEGA